MNSYKVFFLKANILNESEFDILSKFSSFECIMPSALNESLTIKIKINEIIPIDIYSSLVLFKKNNKNVLLKIEAIKKLFSKEKVIDYIQYFSQLFIKNNNLLTELLLGHNIVFENEVELGIKYFTEIDLNELKNIKDKILTFLQNVGFAYTKINFVFDTIKQEKILILEEEKNKIILSKKININSIKALSKNSKMEKNNKISGSFFPLNELTNDMQGNYNVSGEIFSFEKKKIKGNNIIYLFEIYDYTQGALALTCFVTKNNNFKFKDSFTEEYMDSFKKGDWIETKVSLSLDKYNKFKLTGKILKISHANKPKKIIPCDNELEKRVELLCHSKMSSFDGVVSAKEIINFAKQLDYKSVAITDRYSVQSFPEIAEYSKKLSFPIIYGVELEVIPDNITIVKNPKDLLLKDAEYVVFDIETTGLNPEYDEIIEFGALRVKNNIVVEQIQFFIKASNPLSSLTVKLTKITDELVANGLDIKNALIKIKSWFGNSILVAHNGINFDLRFINKHLEKHNIEEINNCIIDTMQLSRYLNNDLTQHNLGRLCRYHKISYNEEIAHRADNDAEFLLHIWEKMQAQLNLLNILNINLINSLQSESLNSSQYGFIVNLYVKNQKGIKDLYTLVSHSLTKGLYKNAADVGRPKITFSVLEKYRQNLIICPHPYEGQIWESALSDVDNTLRSKIKFYDYIFVAPIKNIENQIYNGNITHTNAELNIKKIIDFSIKQDKKVIAVSDCYYLCQYQKIFHDIYVHTKQLKGKRHRLYSYGKTHQVIPDLHFLTTKEMLNEFKFLKDKIIIKNIVIDNSNEFITHIQSNIQPLKKGLFAPNLGDTKTKLTNLVYVNAEKLFGKNIDPIVKTRIEMELKSINDNNYHIIYWISHLLVNKSLSDGYLVGSRGSVGSSFVAFLANISEVNPLQSHYICNKCHYFEWNHDSNFQDGFDLPMKKCPSCGNQLLGDGHNIPFETFLGFKGEKIPDIDLNFSGDYQSVAHNFIKDMFGEMHSFRAGTIATAADKTAYGYVKAYFEESNPGIEINQSYINYLAKNCTDVKRTTGQHPGGIIVVPKDHDINEFTPYNYPADDKSSWYTTHFAFEHIHDNLLKFDILGHDDPTTLKMLERITGIKPTDIPFSDEKIIELFRSSESLNIIDLSYNKQSIGSIALPEFGTPFVRRMLNDTKPKSFADLVRISGLSHGTDVWSNNANTLISEANLKLAQVISCRDDIMIYLIENGVDPFISFEIMEDVRKGKGIKPNLESILKQHNIPEWYITSCKKIKYLFPKAHATAYVIMAWRVAWFKIYYPIQFYATYFTIRTSVFDLETISKGKQEIESKFNNIKSQLDGPNAHLVKTKEKELLDIYSVALEMNARGIYLSTIDLKLSDAVEFIVYNNKIIPPFNAIDSLGLEVAKSIIQARQNKPFSSVADFLSRTKVNDTLFKRLKSLGAFENLDNDDQMSLF